MILSIPFHSLFIPFYPFPIPMLRPLSSTALVHPFRHPVFASLNPFIHHRFCIPFVCPMIIISLSATSFPNIHFIPSNAAFSFVSISSIPHIPSLLHPFCLPHPPFTFLSHPYPLFRPYHHLASLHRRSFRLVDSPSALSSCWSCPKIPTPVS